MSKQEEIDHQISILAQHRRNLSILIDQRSQFNDGMVPLGTINQISSAREQVSRIKKILYEYYSTVVEDLPGIDFEKEKMVSIKVELSLYQRIREIVAKYGIELPEVE